MTPENIENAKVVVDGTPWLVLLTIVLLVGKTVGWWANMSWLWVFSPLWLPFALMFGILALLLLVAAIAAVVLIIMTALDR